MYYNKNIIQLDKENAKMKLALTQELVNFFAEYHDRISCNDQNSINMGRCLRCSLLFHFNSSGFISSSDVTLRFNKK